MIYSALTKSMAVGLRVRFKDSFPMAFMNALTFGSSTGEMGMGMFSAIKLTSWQQSTVCWWVDSNHNSLGVRKAICLFWSFDV